MLSPTLALTIHYDIPAGSGDGQQEQKAPNKHTLIDHHETLRVVPRGSFKKPLGVISVAFTAHSQFPLPPMSLS